LAGRKPKNCKSRNNFINSLICFSSPLEKGEKVQEEWYLLPNAKRVVKAIAGPEELAARGYSRTVSRDYQKGHFYLKL
jgi:hypothetical protein